MKPGTFICHHTGGAHGFLLERGRVFVGDNKWNMVTSMWRANELAPATREPTDDEWGAYCAAVITGEIA